MEEQKNGMAVAGFVLALVALFFGWIPFLGWAAWLLGLIFSGIGLSKANKVNGKGKGLAIAGLVISLIGIALLLFAFGAIGALGLSLLN